MATSCPDSRNANLLGLANGHPQTDIISACWDEYMPDVEITCHTLVGGQILVQMPSKWPQLLLFDTLHPFEIEVHALYDVTCAT